MEAREEYNSVEEKPLSSDSSQDLDVDRVVVQSIAVEETITLTQNDIDESQIEQQIVEVEVEVEDKDKDKDKRINTKALNGLRGILAVHILVFHSLLYSKWQFNLLGSPQMPLFFLISGFILALNDGKKIYNPTKCCSELKNKLNDNDFDAKNFYRRRIARTIPLYYLTNIICIPLIYVGYGWLSPEYGIIVYIAYILTIFVSTTWFAVSVLLNGPSWFVASIWFFYWLFPSLLPRLQQYTDRKKQKWIVYHFWIQFGVAVILAVTFLFIYGGFSFTVATFWPISRLPIFIMGVLCGLLRNKSISIRPSHQKYTANDWKTISDRISIALIIVFVAGSVVETMFGDYYTELDFWLQIILPWWQLQYIYSLTSDNCQSLSYKFLSTKWMLHLGRISYALYLVHEPLMQYICWINYGTQSMPSCTEGSNDECDQQWDQYNDNRLIPVWCIPIHCFVSFILAFLLNRFFEEPLRSWLRP